MAAVYTGYFSRHLSVSFPCFFSRYHFFFEVPNTRCRTPFQPIRRKTKSIRDLACPHFIILPHFGTGSTFSRAWHWVISTVFPRLAPLVLIKLFGKLDCQHCFSCKSNCFKNDFLLCLLMCDLRWYPSISELQC